MEIIYCRGGDKTAPRLAAEAGMRYGVRYDYTAYDRVYMLDVGLAPKWTRYLGRARKLRPFFALTPDYMTPDKIALDLYVQDLRDCAQRIGVCPKFNGAIQHIPTDCVICESVPSVYAGWLIPDDELLPERDYHLLGGDPRMQKHEVRRIQNAGGRVISLDGNKMAQKAAHGQIFNNGNWIKHSGATAELARISAFELMRYFKAEVTP